MSIKALDAVLGHSYATLKFSYIKILTKEEAVVLVENLVTKSKLYIAADYLLQELPEEEIKQLVKERRKKLNLETFINKSTQKPPKEKKLTRASIIDELLLTGHSKDIIVKKVLEKLPNENPANILLQISTRISGFKQKGYVLEKEGEVFKIVKKEV